MNSTSPAPQEAIISAFWRVLAGSGWHGVTMRAIAAEAEISLAELRRHHSSPLSILSAHQRMVDATVLEGTVEDLTSTARDRLFDVLMRRMDALQPDRPGVVRMMQDLPRTPLLALWLGQRLDGSMAWMLEAAGLEAGGPAGAVRTKGLGAVWLSGLRAWEKDETEDLSATMAALDRSLDQADRVARTLRLGGANEAPDASAEPYGETPPPAADPGEMDAQPSPA